MGLFVLVSFYYLALLHVVNQPFFSGYKDFVLLIKHFLPHFRPRLFCKFMIHGDRVWDNSFFSHYLLLKIGNSLFLEKTFQACLLYGELRIVNFMRKAIENSLSKYSIKRLICLCL
jgi:hypothetical protein